MINTHVAVQGVCAWPKLIQFPSGTLVATIFNQPTHGGWEGDLDCWASEDGGEVWAFRGRAAPHEPATNRMHCAAGLARDGHMVVLSSGWDRRPPAGAYSSPHDGQVVPVWVSRSSDAARTWQQAGGAIEQPPGRTLIPFGTIVQSPDGALGAALYGWDADRRERISRYYVSRDDGRTWQFRSVIAIDRSETALLVLPNGSLLAAARTREDAHLELYASSDSGATWRPRGPVSLPSQIPGDLLCLPDGRLLLGYGNRCPNNCGIDVRISRDDGETWGPPIRLADMPLSDGGYPSSVQRADGRIVTAYYQQISGSNHYEFRVATWEADECEKLYRYAAEPARTPRAPDRAPPEASPSAQSPLDTLAAKMEPSRKVVYKTVPDRDRRLELHVFEPLGHKQGDMRPAFVTFHGGGWMGRNPRYFYPFASHFAALGMVGISVEYRLRNERDGTVVLDCVRDARTAVRYVRAHASELGIDPGRIVVSGGSAGGHLAAGTALFDGLDEANEDTATSCVG